MLYSGIRYILFFGNLKMRKLFVHMIKYRKALGIDSHNSYAQQWNLMYLI
jgi:hypothetical protein